MYTFYSRSHNRTDELDDLADETERKVVSFQRIDGTRWLGHHVTGMTAFLKNWPVLVDHLQDLAARPGNSAGTEKAKAKGWLKKITNYKFFYFIHFYLDLISQLSKVAYAFQESSVTLSDVLDTVSACLGDVQDLAVSDGAWLATAKAILFENSNDETLEHDENPEENGETENTEHHDENPEENGETENAEHHDKNPEEHDKNPKQHDEMPEEVDETPEEYDEIQEDEGEDLTEETEDEEEEQQSYIYKGITVTNVYNDNELPTSFTSEKSKVLEDVQSCLKKRFQDFCTNPVLSKAKVIDPTNWPQESEGEQALKDYGNEEIGALLGHYTTILEEKGCIIPLAKQEWKHLKVYCRMYHSKTKQYLKLWKKVFNDQRALKKFPNVLHIVAVVLTLPLSNAQLERAFSGMKRVHNDERASLTTPTVYDLLTVMMDGPEVEELDSTPAVKSWVLDLGGKIRPNKHKKKKIVAESDSDSEMEVENTDSDEEVVDESLGLELDVNLTQQVTQSNSSSSTKELEVIEIVDKSED